jgi:hypothetical protein
VIELIEEVADESYIYEKGVEVCNDANAVILSPTELIRRNIPSHLSIIRIYSIPMGAQVIKNRSTGNIERFLSSIRFENRKNLDELELD